MAIVKAKFVKRGIGEKARAKATILYIQNRRGKEGEKITRTLFGSDGKMERHEAYRMIDDAEKGSIYFKFVINFDPEAEDKPRDLHLREIAHTTMLALEERINKPVTWVAAEHADHTPLRHIHILAAVPTPLYVPDFDHLRTEATAACLEQRRELDRMRQWTREREEAEWVRAL